MVVESGLGSGACSEANLERLAQKIRDKSLRTNWSPNKFVLQLISILENQDEARLISLMAKELR